MDYYFAAANDEAARKSLDLPGGPMPDTEFASAEAKDVLACPHLEQLVEFASGKSGPSLVPQLVTLNDDPMLHRLPDQLRDDLAAIEMTGSIAERWAAELWGYAPDDALRVGAALIAVARRAHDAGQPLFWWSEM